MKFEADEVTFLGGVRHGLTMGGPVAIQVGNSEWPKGPPSAAADPVDEGSPGRTRAQCSPHPTAPRSR